MCARRHLSTAIASGTSSLQNLNASSLQAARCSGVPWANAGADAKSANGIAIQTSLRITVFLYFIVRRRVDVTRRPSECNLRRSRPGGQPSYSSIAIKPASPPDAAVFTLSVTSRVNRRR